MSGSRRPNKLSSEDEFEPTEIGAAAENAAAAALAAGDWHARALQQRLFEAYSARVLEPKLPAWQRIVIIVSASAALWLLIVGAIALAL